jgi:hypothetical protein
MTTSPAETGCQDRKARPGGQTELTESLRPGVGGRSAGSAPAPTWWCPAALLGEAAAMAPVAGDAAYFKRGSLFWFAVITVSFGYYTVRTVAQTRKGPSVHPRPSPRPRQQRPRRRSPGSGQAGTAWKESAGTFVGRARGTVVPALRNQLGRSSHGSPSDSSGSRTFKMVVAKSEVGRDAAVYFRTARPLPSLVTVLALGYVAVRRAGGGASPGPGCSGKGLSVRTRRAVA